MTKKKKSGASEATDTEATRDTEPPQALEPPGGSNNEKQIRARLAELDANVGECLREINTINEQLEDVSKHANELNERKHAVSTIREQIEAERARIIAQLGLKGS